jgi:glucan phosphorylase
VAEGVRNGSIAGKFSADRTIREHARDIWKIKPAAIGNFAHAVLLE